MRPILKQTQSYCHCVMVLIPMRLLIIEPPLVVFHSYHEAVMHSLSQISSLFTSPPSCCAFLSETRSRHRGPHTFNGGVKVGIFVQHFHLLAPVKLIPPVVHHLPQVAGVEAVVEGGSFHVRCEAEPIQALVEILWKGALLASLASCCHVPYARAGTDRLSWLCWLLYYSLGHHKPS